MSRLSMHEKERIHRLSAKSARSDGTITKYLVGHLKLGAQAHS